MALSANRATMLRHPEAAALRVRYPVKSGAHIYKGALVAINAGYLAPAANTAGLLVKGIAEEEVDNSGADGAAYCDVICNIAGRFVGSGIVAADVGKKCYAVDDQTVADTDPSNGVVAGVIEELEAPNVVWVYVTQQS